MPRPISRQQFSDLFFAEFFRPAPGFANGSCILCGNSGRIDTRGKVHNGKGEECGGEALCICPNGRAFKRHVEADARRKAREDAE